MGDGQRVGGEGSRSGDKTNKINFILLNSNFTSVSEWDWYTEDLLFALFCYFHVRLSPPSSSSPPPLHTHTHAEWMIGMNALYFLIICAYYAYQN